MIASFLTIAKEHLLTMSGHSLACFLLEKVLLEKSASHYKSRTVAPAAREDGIAMIISALKYPTDLLQPSEL